MATVRSVAAKVGGWFYEAVPLGRVAAFRTLCYLFVVADLMVFTNWVRSHASVPGSLYQPLAIGRILPLPTPTPLLINTIYVVLIVLALVAATGRWPRLLGWPIFFLYLEWMIIAMSYGKVDHDRVGFLVALAVLPTVGRARHGDATRSEAAGWALRCTQIAVIATYFLASWAKLRFGGIAWLSGATLTRSVLRRGTWVARLLLDVPGLLVAAQWGIVIFELASPLIFFLKERWRIWAIGGFYLFHVVVFSTITISFLPHLVAMAAFLPLEKVRPVTWVRRLRRKPEVAVETAA